MASPRRAPGRAVRPGFPLTPARWLVGLWLLAALQYGGAAIVLRADPLLLYLLVQLSWLSAVLLSILEPGQARWWPGR